MYERYRSKGIEVIMRSQEECRKIGRNFVGSELILLGILEVESNAQKALNRYNINIEVVRHEVIDRLGKGSSTTIIEIPFSGDARLVLETALKEADKLIEEDTLQTSEIINPEHLLLGILLTDNPAHDILISLGISDDIKSSLIETLKNSIKQPPIFNPYDKDFPLLWNSYVNTLFPKDELNRFNTFNSLLTKLNFKKLHNLPSWFLSSDTPTGIVQLHISLNDNSITVCVTDHKGTFIPNPSISRSFPLDTSPHTILQFLFLSLSS